MADFNHLSGVSSNTRDNFGKNVSSNDFDMMDEPMDMKDGMPGMLSSSSMFIPGRQSPMKTKKELVRWRVVRLAVGACCGGVPSTTGSDCVLLHYCCLKVFVRATAIVRRPAMQTPITLKPNTYYCGCAIAAHNRAPTL